MTIQNTSFFTVGEGTIFPSPHLDKYRRKKAVIYDPPGTLPPGAAREDRTRHKNPCGAMRL